MSTVKKAKVVMLPTNEKTNIINTNQGLLYNSNDYIGINQHLYIISDDKIKKDDWCIDSNGIIFQHKNHFPISIGQRKIIATTNTLLKIEINGNRGDLLPDVSFDINLPQPSQQFIQKYIEEYNKGNVITDVLVEYEYLLDDMVVLPYWKLKVNAKDNTITIKKVKENFTKNEVISLCDDAYKVGYGTAVCEETNQGKEVSFKEWLSTSVLDTKPNKIYTKDEVIRLLEKYTSFIWSEVGIHYPVSLSNNVKDTFINRELK